MNKSTLFIKSIKIENKKTKHVKCDRDRIERPKTYNN